MKDLLLWNKISRIVMLLAECLDIYGAQNETYIED